MLFHPSKIPFIFWPSKKRGPNSPHCIYFPHRLLEPPTLGSAIAEEIRFFEATDILLDTSTNDGLNLIPFTFYAAHSQAGLFLDCFFHTKMWLLLWVFFVSHSVAHHRWLRRFCKYQRRFGLCCQVVEVEVVGSLPA